MTSLAREATCLKKGLLIFDKVLFPYHPFFSDESIRKRLKRNQDELESFTDAVPSFVEYAVRTVGKWKHCDRNGQDLSDGSDVKTAYIHKTEGMLVVKNVRTAYGGLKKGALRVVVANLFTEDVDLLYIPRNVWIDRVSEAGDYSCGYKRTRDFYTHLNYGKRFSSDEFEQFCKYK
jgi:hypothetical protein